MTVLPLLEEADFLEVKAEMAAFIYEPITGAALACV